MSTRDTIKSYYNSLKQKEGWESFLADEMTFINNGKQLKGKDAALEGFGRFFSMVQSLDSWFAHFAGQLARLKID